MINAPLSRLINMHDNSASQLKMLLDMIYDSHDNELKELYRSYSNSQDMDKPVSLNLADADKAKLLQLMKN